MPAGLPLLAFAAFHSADQVELLLPTYTVAPARQVPMGIYLYLCL